MWEEAIPWIWGWAQGWLTPAVLFVLLNLVIGTIAVTSKGIVPRDPQPPAGAAGAGAGADELRPADAPPRKLPRAPSRLLDRLRSFTLQPQPNLRGAAPPPPPQALAAEDENRADPDEDGEDEEGKGEELRLPHGHGQQLGRSHSDAHPAAGESPPPPPLAARMKKSASENSAFAHFEAAEVADAAAAAEPGDEDDDDEAGGGGGGEVDARADDFINRFKHQLKLQRIDSIMRYKETLNRNGGGGPTGSTPPNQLK